MNVVELKKPNMASDFLVGVSREIRDLPADAVAMSLTVLIKTGANTRSIVHSFNLDPCNHMGVLECSKQTVFNAMNAST